MKQTILLFIFTFSLFFTLYAQEQKTLKTETEITAHEHSDICRTGDVMAKLYRENPEILQEHLGLEEFTRDYIEMMKQNPEMRRKATYTIPVVFHVFHENGPEKISVSQCQSALDIANRDFNGWNNDFNSVDPRYNGIKATLNIDFCMASIDPSGNSTEGVTWHYSSACGEEVSEICQYNWDNERYYNIYILRDLHCNGSYSSSGVSWYPSTYDSNLGRARTLYNHRYLGDEGTAAGSHNPEGFQSTFSHECGHWLNLIHTFEGGCSQGDNVSDTPPTSGSEGCGDNRTSSCGGYYNAENYMDYNTSCYAMYTQGQTSRMTAALNSSTGYRNNMWTNSTLVSTGCGGSSSVNESDKIMSSLNAYPNPTEGYLNIDFTADFTDNYLIQVKNIIGQTIYSETLVDYLGGYSKTLNLSEFGRGTYTIHLKSSKSETIKKVMVF